MRRFVSCCCGGVLLAGGVLSPRDGGFMVFFAAKSLWLAFTLVFFALGMRWSNAADVPKARYSGGEQQWPLW